MEKKPAICYIGAMKKLILLLLVSTNITLANDYDSCLDRIYGQHQAELDTAKEVFKRQSEDCFRFPEGEEYYACQHKAQETFDRAVEKANIKVKLGEKDCLKYPW